MSARRRTTTHDARTDWINAACDEWARYYRSHPSKPSPASVQEFRAALERSVPIGVTAQQLELVPPTIADAVIDWSGPEPWAQATDILLFGVQDGQLVLPAITRESNGRTALAGGMVDLVHRDSAHAPVRVANMDEPRVPEALREAFEELTLPLRDAETAPGPGALWEVGRFVAERRATDRGNIETTLCAGYVLPGVDGQLPTLRAADDAKSAQWMPLTTFIEQSRDGKVHGSHAAITVHAATRWFPRLLQEPSLRAHFARATQAAWDALGHHVEAPTRATASGDATTTATRKKASRPPLPGL